MIPLFISYITLLKASLDISISIGNEIVFVSEGLRHIYLYRSFRFSHVNSSQPRKNMRSKELRYINLPTFRAGVCTGQVGGNLQFVRINYISITPTHGRYGI